MATTETIDRLWRFDALRILAILGVVAIHTWSYLPSSLHPGTGSWWLAEITLSVGRWAVPLFVLVSGAFILKPGRTLPIGEFYRHRLRRIAVPAAAWISAYFVYRATYLGEHLTPHKIVSDLLMGTAFTHIYFIYVIAGLYLVAPLLQPAVRSLSAEELIGIALVLLALRSVETALPYGLASVGPISGLTLWTAYLGYFLAGAGLRQLKVTRRASRGALGVLVLAALAPALAYLFLVSTGESGWVSYLSSYFSPLTISGALAAFLIVSQEPPRGTAMHGGHALRVVAGATLGVYLLHEMVLWTYMREVGGWANVPPYLERLPAYFVTVAFSFGAVLLARRVPVVNWAL